MRKVGFIGGSSGYEIGSKSDMVVFLNCIEIYASDLKEFDVKALVTELYERYIAFEDYEKFKKMIEHAELKFKKIEVSLNILKLEGYNPDQTFLDITSFNLFEIFKKYFLSAREALNDSLYFKDKGYNHKPLRIGFTDALGFALDLNRTLKDYDDNESNPFWLY